MIMLAALSIAAACDHEPTTGSAAGARVYRELCASCHGASGVPSDGARALGAKDLTDRKLHERLGDADLRRQIRDGSTNKRMPAFERMVDNTTLDALVLHVRSLAAVGPPSDVTALPSKETSMTVYAATKLAHVLIAVLRSGLSRPARSSRALPAAFRRSRCDRSCAGQWLESY